MIFTSFGQEPAAKPGHDGKAAEVRIPAGTGKMNPSVHEAEKPGVVRTYFIAADEVDWDYTPRGRNLAGLPHVETAEDEAGAGAGHRVYHKAIYREDTDPTFKTLKIRPQQWEHLYFGSTYPRGGRRFNSGRVQEQHPSLGHHASSRFGVQERCGGSFV